MLKVNKNCDSNNANTLNGVAWMSFLWSVSTLMVFSVLGAFLVDELKMRHSHIGIIEGLAISASFLSKFFSGYLSDVFKNRKSLILVGTVMTALIKPLFAFSSSAGLIFGARFTDRLAKGIRSAPTDALIADLSDKSLYASNFGYREALSTLGRVVGALIAMAVLLWSNNNYRLLFGLASIPAFMATMVLWFFVKPDPNTHPRIKAPAKSIQFSDFKEFPAAFWWLMAAFFFLMMARFSEAFVTLKAKDVGWSIAYLPLLVVISDLVHSSFSWPAGKFADRFSRKQMLAFGLMLMIAAQTVLSYVTTVSGVVFGIILLGLHMGTTQGLLKALIAESTPPELRGTAFSLFFIISGFALFLGNTIAGHLSHHFGLYAMFLGGAAFTSLSVAIIYAVFLHKPARRVGLEEQRLEI